MLKKEKEDMMTVFHVENTNKEIENFLKDQTKIMELESIITKMKSSVKGLNCRFDLAEEIMSKFGGRLIEIMQSEEQRENEWRKMNRSSKKSRTSLGALTYMSWDTNERREKREQDNIQRNNG